MVTLAKKVKSSKVNQDNHYEVLNFTTEEFQQKCSNLILEQIDTSEHASLKEDIDKKRRKAVSSKTKDIKINVVCINKPSEQSLSNFAVKYQEILNRRGMRDE